MPKRERGLASFQFLASNAPYKLSVFAMDGNKAKLPTGIDEWERREPGSLAGVLNAYAHCVNKIDTRQPFTTEDILKIHEQCVDKVSGTVYDKIKHRSTHSVNKGFRKYSESVTFRFIPGVNLSKAGCKNVAEYIWNNIVDHENPSYMLHHVSSAKEIEDILIQHVNTGADNHSPLSPLIDGLVETKDNSTLPTRIQQVLDNLYQQLDNIPGDPQAEDLKITAIVSAVQELEQMHPFQDANCRTFCLVLLNSLLMQQGYDPAIIDDPNKFDGFSVEELVEVVKCGMQETRKLVEETYEQEYSQRCSELSEDSDDEPNYDGYYYLTDDSASDKSEEDEWADSQVIDTHYADFLTERLNTLAKTHEIIEKFAQMKDTLQSSKKEEHQKEQQDSTNSFTRSPE